MSLLTVAYLGAAILFILSLGGLSTQESARRGNWYGIIGMVIALAATMLHDEVGTYEITAHGTAIIHGRSDATLNPGGVRIGTAEIYRVVEELEEVVESVATCQLVIF